MNRSTKAFLGFIVVAVVVIIGLKFVLPILKARRDRATSDAIATKGTITVPIDSWPGYFPLRSPRMKKEMRENGYLFECEDDGADLAKRAERLAKGEVGLAVFTVDSYIMNAAKHQFPGTFVMVIDESKGGDAIVAYEDVLPNLDAFKTNQTFKIAYTPNSPSHHLLRIVGAHFDIPTLKRIPKTRKIETASSEEAFKLFKAKQVDAAVVWEPDVSKARQLRGAKLTIGTESMTRSVVDGLVVNREWAEKHKEELDIVLRSYFRVLKYYLDNPNELIADMRRELGFSKEQAESVMKGILWINLTENAQDWYGLTSGGVGGDKGIIDTIDSAVDVLRDSGDLLENPFPNKDPYFITNKKFVEELYRSGIKNGFKSLAAGSNTNLSAGKFPEISELQWNKQREVGTIKVEPITFRKGSSVLSQEGKEELDKIGNKIRHYPAFRIALKGHTSPEGDLQVNKELSLARAETVKQYLSVTFGIDENRMRALGFGGEKPLLQEPDEPNAQYRFRLSRVEISFLSDVF